MNEELWGDNDKLMRKFMMANTCSKNIRYVN